MQYKCKKEKKTTTISFNANNNNQQFSFNIYKRLVKNVDVIKQAFA